MRPSLPPDVVSDPDRLSASAGEDWAERTVIQQAPAGDRRAGNRQDWAWFLVFREAGDPAAPIARHMVGHTPVRIGRREPCELLLRDTEVSGLHCQVQLRDGQLQVVDLGSTNGSFIDGLRVEGTATLSSGVTLQVGRQFLKVELRDRQELAQSAELSRDLERASHYVLSMLPAPWHQGPLRIEWRYQPSAEVGGDGFGYFALDATHVVIYIVDVSGHGVGAAMHLVAVLAALRQRALNGADFTRPSEVLGSLNDMFQMDRHDGMLFSIWYGVYNLTDRNLGFASGGHHPAYLLPAAGGPARPLHCLNPYLGALPGLTVSAGAAQLGAGDRLYLFSDGVFEITPRTARPWGLDDFVALLGRSNDPTASEPEHLYQLVRQQARAGPLEDDFSLLTVTIP